MSFPFRTLMCALALCAGPVLVSAPDLRLHFAAAVPSGPVFAGVPVELFATLKVICEEGLDRGTLTGRQGFDVRVRWQAGSGSLAGPARTAVLGRDTRPPNGLVFVNRTVYTPPAMPGVYTVSARPEADPGQEITLRIVVEAVHLEIHPGSATLAPGQDQTFTATFQGPPGAPLAWYATGGTLSPQGVYRAPAEPGIHTVSVRHPPSGRIASARVKVMSPTGIQPPSPELAPGESLRFQCMSLQGDVAWSVLERDGGTIAPDGTYTAPKRPGVYHVEATQAHGGFRATVTVAPVTLALEPAATTLGMGQRLQFKVSPSRGGCSWSATAGEITEEGLFLAPLVPGTCEIAARSTLDPGTIATATVEIVAPSQLQILPDALTLRVGQAQQFTALGLPPGASPSWQVEPSSVGTITEDGRFTAGPEAGHCSVMVFQDDMISSAAVELVDSRILPDPARVRPGGTLQLSVRGLPDGSPATWSVQPVEAGEITCTGLFTAGSRPGSCTVSVSAGGTAVSAPLNILSTLIEPDEALVPPGGTIHFTCQSFAGGAPTWRMIGDHPGAYLGQDGTYRAPVRQGIYQIALSDASGRESRARVTVGPPKALVVAPEIRVMEAGIYTVRVRLQAANGRTMEGCFTGELRPGLVSPEVAFLAWPTLASLEADGPYAIALIALSGSFGEEAVLFDAREDMGNTLPFSLPEAAREWIHIGWTPEARGEDPDAAGRFRILRVSVPVELTSDGEYRISGTLKAGGVEIETRTETRALPRGPHTVTLRFDGARIRALAGERALSLASLTLEGPVTRTREFPDPLEGIEAWMFAP